MTDVFISYSHRDQPFALQLVGALVQHGYTTWFDQNNIPPAAKFRKEIKAGIEEAGAFIFLLSPDSIVSEECLNELKYARECQKKLISLCYRQVDPRQVPQMLQELNWIQDDSFDHLITKVLDAIQTDLSYWQRAGQWLRRASQWNEDHRHNSSLLLRGKELREAERWLKVAKEWQQDGSNRKPQPIQLHINFIRESHHATHRFFLASLTVLFLLVSFTAGGAFWLLHPNLTLVTTLQETGQGSLRQVIEAAPPGSTISFAPGLKGRIALARSLEIKKNVIIQGPGINALSIGSAAGPRVDLDLITVLSGANVTFSDLTLRELQPYDGPLIENEGTLTINRCRIIGNTELRIKTKNTVFAAAINNYLGTLILRNSVITKNTLNTGLGGGGSIENYKGTVTVIDSQITDNTVKSSGIGAVGGAIDSSGGKVVLTNSIISGNHLIGGTLGAAGGGIRSDQGTLTLTSSVVANNSVSSDAIGAGGGIYSNGSTITLMNSRVTNNTLAAHKGANGGGISTIDGSLSLTNSAVLKNAVSSDNENGSFGGGIDSSNTTIMLMNSQVADNTLDSDVLGAGGGISAQGGSVAFDNSMITSNTIRAPEVFGGGISSLKGKVTITNTTVSNNTARGAQKGSMGGGIFDGDTLTIANSSISNNTLTSTDITKGGAIGGGIAVQGALDLSRSTVSGNTVNDSNGISNGAGIMIEASGDSKNIGETLKLTNCTVSGNTASGSQGSYGGGVEAEGVEGTIDFCTIYGNTASSRGGGFITGVAASARTSNIKFKNTLIANNLAAKGPDIAGTITTDGYNLVQHFSSAKWNDPTNKHATDLSGDTFPDLGIDPQLRASGNATPTHALLPNSPALNRIPSGSCDVPVDQRGVKRPQQGSCDIGAYEYA